MSKKKSSLGRILLRGATRFLFPYDAPRSHGQVNDHRYGDKCTRQYKDSGRTREIAGSELRRNRQRAENYRKNS
jgi:hypothetical protein